MASDEQKRNGEIDEKTTSQPEPSATAELHAQSQKFWRTFLKKMAIAARLFGKGLYRLRLNRLDLARADRRLGAKAYATGTAEGQVELVSRLDRVTERLAQLRRQEVEPASTFGEKAKLLASRIGKAIQIEALKLRRRRILRRLGANLRQSAANTSLAEETQAARAVTDQLSFVETEIRQLRPQTYPWARQPLLLVCLLLLLAAAGGAFVLRHQPTARLAQRRGGPGRSSLSDEQTNNVVEQEQTFQEQMLQMQAELARRGQEQMQARIAAAERVQREEIERRRAEQERVLREQTERERVAAAERARQEEKQREEERRIAAAEKAKQEQQAREGEAQRESQRQKAAAIAEHATKQNAGEQLVKVKIAAEAGDREAMFNLGVSYNKGEGVAKDPAEALRWYRKAAEAGHIAAMFNVGVAYANGEGVEKDVKEAIRWYREAADAGDVDAMLKIALMYQKALDEAVANLDGPDIDPQLEKDGLKATELLRKAAEARSDKAQAALKTVRQRIADREPKLQALQEKIDAEQRDIWARALVLSDGRHVVISEKDGEFYAIKSLGDPAPVKLTGPAKEEAKRLLKERQSRPANIPPTIAVPTEPPSSSSPSQTGAQPSAAASPKQSAESRTAGMPPGLEEFEKIPHDPQLLDKLYAGRFDEIGQDKMDLVAVWKGFQDSKVSLNDRSGIQFGPEQMGQMQRYFSDAVMAVEMLISRRVQPNYLKTVTSIQANGGGDSEWAQTTLKNLFRLILQRASGQMPATAEKDWPLMRRSLLNVSDPEILQMAQALTANERAAVEKQMKELGEKGAQVILSEYSDPSEKSSYHRQRLLFWYRDVPVLRRDLLAISNSHPLAELGNLAVTEVPPVLAEAKEKHAEAMAAEGKRVEITPDIDNPEYVGWKGLAPRASATYARNSWIQSGQSKEPTQNGTELRILQSISDANAVVKINEQLGQSVKKETRTFEAKIPDRRDPDERRAPVQEEVELNGRKFKCSRRSHVWKGLEEKATTTIWTSDEVPGGLVRRLVDSEDTHAVHRLSDTTLQSYTGGRNGDWSGKPEGSPLFKTVFSFTRQSGIYPSGRLVEGEDGSFYGTTWDGPMTKDGHWGAGTVFRLSPDGALTTLHTFHNEDGAHPAWGLTKGRDGNLYGTTRENGLAQKGAAHTTGFGTVFKITPSGQFTTLHYFGEPPDGKKPAGELLLASDGNLYGTTPGGGAGGCGTVFRITPSGAFSIVHSFSVSPEEGCGPHGRLVEGPDGSLYGATAYGGRTARHASSGHGGSDSGKGTIFKMTFAGKVTTLYHFGGDESDGKRPEGGLTKGTDGSLYGTTREGGGDSVIGVGTIFKFTPPADYSVVFSFKVATDDGYGPSGPLTLGRDGNLYGTTTNGGNIRDRGEPPGNGTVFRFSSVGALTTLHTFRREGVRHRNFGIGESGNTAKAQWAEHELAAGREHPEITDGKSPIAGLIEAKDGMLYGTTSAGGIWEFGTIFKVDPKAFKDQ